MIVFLRDLFLKDFWLKLFSLALAVLIWLTISFAIRKEFSPLPNMVPRGTPRTFFSLPVGVVSSAEGSQNFKVEPSEVDVTVEGDPRVMDNLQSKEIRVSVDLSGIAAARDLMKRIEVSTPAGIRQVRVVPSEVKIMVSPRT